MRAPRPFSLARITGTAGRLALATSLVLTTACSRPDAAAGPPAGSPPAQQAQMAAQWPPSRFEPARNPARDLERAIAEAGQTGKRIILDVGGEWCSWCHILDKFIADHPDLKAAVARDYVWLKVNMSPENENTEFLSRYPRVPGYPHLFVLEKNGTLLHSQDTVELEEGKSYNLEKLRGFLARWKPGA